MRSRIRCSSSRRVAIGALPVIAAVMAVPARPWEGNDMDTYANDLAALVKALELKRLSTSAIPPAAAKSILFRAPRLPEKKGSLRHPAKKQ